MLYTFLFTIYNKIIIQDFFTRKMSDSETIELACLGRPFQLGMLYDCRRDVLVPGNIKHILSFTFGVTND